MFRVVGRARRAQPLLAAPVSGRPCLAWRLVVDPGGGRSTRMPRQRPDAAAWPSTCAPARVLDRGRQRPCGGASREPTSPWRCKPGTKRAARALVAAARHGAGRDPTSPRIEVGGHRCLGSPPRGGRRGSWSSRSTRTKSSASAVSYTAKLHPLGEAGPRAAPMRWTFRGTAEQPADPHRRRASEGQAGALGDIDGTAAAPPELDGGEPGSTPATRNRAAADPPSPSGATAGTSRGTRKLNCKGRYAGTGAKVLSEVEQDVDQGGANLARRPERDGRDTGDPGRALDGREQG